MATAVDAVSEAARSIGSAQEDASALSGAALQAAAALSSLNSTADGTSALLSGKSSDRGRDPGKGKAWDRRQAESKSFALGRCLCLPVGGICLQTMLSAT